MILDMKRAGLDSEWVQMHEGRVEEFRDRYHFGLSYAIDPDKLMETRNFLIRRSLAQSSDRVKAIRALHRAGVSLMILGIGLLLVTGVVTFIIALTNLGNLTGFLTDLTSNFPLPTIAVWTLFGITALGIVSVTVAHEMRKRVITILDDLDARIIDNGLAFGELTSFRVGSAIFEDDKLAWSAALLYGKYQAVIHREIEACNLRDRVSAIKSPSAAVKHEINEAETQRKKAHIERGKLGSQLADLLDRN